MSAFLPPILGWAGDHYDPAVLSFNADGDLVVTGTGWPAAVIQQFPVAAGSQAVAKINFLDAGAWFKITENGGQTQLLQETNVTGQRSVTIQPTQPTVEVWAGKVGDGSMRVRGFTVDTAAAQPAITLTPVNGPVRSTRNGQIIENLDVTNTNGSGIVVTHNDVTVRFCRVKHQGTATVDSYGVVATGVSGFVMHDVEVTQTIGDTTKNSPNENCKNVQLEDCTGPIVYRIKASRGLSNIYLLNTTSAHIYTVQLEDVRGRPNDVGGNNVQFDKSGGVLEDFSCNNGANSFTEDNISLPTALAGTIVRRGRVHHNNSPSGFGVITEPGSAGVLIEDVDATEMGNGAFSLLGAPSTLNRCRTRDGHNVGIDGRAAPSSNGVSLDFRNTSGKHTVTACRYFNPANPNNLVNNPGATNGVDFTQENFTPRPFLNLTFPWG
jgi:predicted RNA-binding protein with TRAM domain